MKFCVTVRGREISTAQITEFERAVYAKRAKDLTLTEYRYAVDIPNVDVGVELLNQLNLKSENVRNSCITRLYENPNIYIDYEMAKHYPIFDIKNSIDIRVEECALNQFVEIKPFKSDREHDMVELKYVLNEEKAIDFLKANNFSETIYSDDFQKKIDERKAYINQMTIKEEEYNQQEELREKKEKEEKELKRQQYVEERTNWINEFGSDELKDALMLGLHVNYKYIKERALSEFPEYELDYNDNATWKDRTKPSSKGISELKEIRQKYPELESELVWLTRPQNQSGYYEYEFEEHEAIVITNFLNKNTLIKQV